MKTVSKGLIFAATLALQTLTTPLAHAQMVCGGNDFATCASVVVTVTDLGGGQVGINMVVTNNSGVNGTFAGTTFTDIGLFGLGNFAYVSGSLVTSGSGTWQLGPNGLSGAGIQAQVSGVQPVNPQPDNGLKANQTVNITFKITGVTAASIDPNDWAIHGQTGPNDCSTKLVVTNGVPNNGPFDTERCGVESSVTPEPASVALMGTGLMGLGAGAWVRRRRKV